MISDGHLAISLGPRGDRVQVPSQTPFHFSLASDGVIIENHAKAANIKRQFQNLAGPAVSSAYPERGRNPTHKRHLDWPV